MENRQKIDLLIKEYELCQQKTRGLESTIWQTNAVIGVGSAGTFVALILKRIEGMGPAFGGVLAIGFVVIGISFIWYRMAGRWWSIEHTIFERMRQIEREIKTCSGCDDIFLSEAYIGFRDSRRTQQKKGKKGLCIDPRDYGIPAKYHDAFGLEENKGYWIYGPRTQSSIFVSGIIYAWLVFLFYLALPCPGLKIAVFAILTLAFVHRVIFIFKNA